jgi:hypothetical protein
VSYLWGVAWAHLARWPILVGSFLSQVDQKQILMDEEVSLFIPQDAILTFSSFFFKGADLLLMPLYRLPALNRFLYVVSEEGTQRTFCQGS